MISIHALREEGDFGLAAKESREPISIHALREEGDEALSWPFTNRCDFYPRPPRGGRLDSNIRAAIKQVFLSTPSARRATTDMIGGGWLNLFLSTPSARRATQRRAEERRAQHISIHSLREEGDSKNRDKISIFL